jgi:hypothetical protein
MSIQFIEGHLQKQCHLCGALRDSDKESICETKRDMVGHRTIVRDTESLWGTLRTDTEGLHGSLGNTEEF